MAPDLSYRTRAIHGRRFAVGSRAVDHHCRDVPVRPSPKSLQRLRLVGSLSDSALAATAKPTSLRVPIDDATDPRWVLAVRTAALLEGSILPPENRQRLVRLGRTLGMTAFDANLIIAIVQDQTRHEHPPQVVDNWPWCPIRTDLRHSAVAALITPSC